LRSISKSRDVWFARHAELARMALVGAGEHTCRDRFFREPAAPRIKARARA